MKAEEPYPMQIGRGLCRVLDVSTQEEEHLMKAEEPYPMQIGRWYVEQLGEKAEEPYPMQIGRGF